MSNYLQRMALSAIQPGGHLHPVLDPMFSSPRRPSEIEPPSFAASDSTVAEPADHAAPASTPSLTAVAAPGSGSSGAPQPILVADHLAAATPPRNLAVPDRARPASVGVPEPATALAEVVLTRQPAVPSVVPGPPARPTEFRGDRAALVPDETGPTIPSVGSQGQSDGGRGFNRSQPIGAPFPGISRSVLNTTGNPPDEPHGETPPPPPGPFRHWLADASGLPPPPPIHGTQVNEARPAARDDSALQRGQPAFALPLPAPSATLSPETHSESGTVSNEPRPRPTPATWKGLMSASIPKEATPPSHASNLVRASVLAKWSQPLNQPIAATGSPGLAPAGALANRLQVPAAPEIESQPISRPDQPLPPIAARQPLGPPHAGHSASEPRLPEAIETSDAAPITAQRSRAPSHAPKVAASPASEVRTSPFRPSAEPARDGAILDRSEPPYVPLVAARSSASDTTTGSPALRPGPAVPGLRKWRDNSGPAHDSSSSIRDPDDIQIHIGRIEVTAAQPPPRPVIARPQRKAPSLAEYLRRRDRRVS